MERDLGGGLVGLSEATFGNDPKLDFVVGSR